MPTQVCVIQALTLDKLGSTDLLNDLKAIQVSSLAEAFEFFCPEADFEFFLKDSGEVFRIRRRIMSLDDFTPERMCAGSENNEEGWNDLGGLTDYITLLEHVRRLYGAARRRGLAPETVVVKSAVGSLFASEMQRRQTARAFHRLIPRSAGYRAIEVEPLSPPANVNLADAATNPLAELDSHLNAAIKLRNQLLGALFREMRGLEIRWQSLAAFFANSQSDHEDTNCPVHILNVDLRRVKSNKSIDLIERALMNASQKKAIEDNIFMTVIPFVVDSSLSSRLLHIARTFGFILVGDVNVGLEDTTGERQFRFPSSDIRREFVYAVGSKGWLRFRAPHSFENESDEVGFQTSVALALAGVIYREIFGYQCTSSWALSETTNTVSYVFDQNEHKAGKGDAFFEIAVDNSGNMKFLGCDGIDLSWFGERIRTQCVVTFVDRYISSLLASLTTVSRETLFDLEDRLRSVLQSLAVSKRLQQFSLFVNKRWSNIEEQKIELCLDLDVQTLGGGRKFRVDVWRGANREYERTWTELPAQNTVFALSTGGSL